MNETPERLGSLPALAFLSLLAGAGSGLLTALFRLALDRADNFRNLLIAHAHNRQLAGFLFVAAAGAGAVGAAAWLVRRCSPYAGGSGIPQVEAELAGDLPPAPPRLILVKFLGGLLAIGAGLALGREGPSVQMGAVIASQTGKAFGRDLPDCRVLLAAGAGAGLAVAFNAPIAGAVFVLEELLRRFDTRTAIAALGASATAILVARLLLGNAPDFQVSISAAAHIATGPLPYAVAATWPLYFATGIGAGLVAAVYNRTLLGTISLAERLRRWPVELQAGLIGAAVAILGWFLPELVGGGDDIRSTCWRTARALPSCRSPSYCVWTGRPVLCGAHAGRALRPAAGAGAQLGFVAWMCCARRFRICRSTRRPSRWSAWRRFLPASSRRRSPASCLSPR